LPEPSVPNCSAQFPAYFAGSNPAFFVSVSTRFSAVAVSCVLYAPADSGMARSIDSRSAARS
jgi:hypothetical protein